MKQWQGPDRRNKPDKWVSVVHILAIVSWTLFIFALIMSFYAAPEEEYGITKYHDISVRKFWLTPLTGYLYVVLWGSALLSYVSVIINHYRSRRASDSKHINLTMLFLICLAWVIYIVLHVK